MGQDGILRPIVNRPFYPLQLYVDLNLVGHQYFDVMKMPIVLGRALTLRDSEASRKVAVINETMAHTHFPGGSPLGRTFGVGDEPSGKTWRWSAW